MVKTISITGAARSGSTILDMVLGNIPGAFSAGEVRHLWQRGLVDRRLCGCSAPVPDCELWPAIVERAFPAGIDAQGTAQLMRYLRTRFTPAARLRRLHGWYDKKLSPLIDVMDRLYPAIAAETGATFVVDSSKLSTYTYLLSRAPSIDLRIVHLIRDPRAVAHSYGRAKPQLDAVEARPMATTGPLRAAMDWNVWNTTVRSMFRDAAGGYLLLRYEDLICDPAAGVQQILAMAGEPDADIGHIANGTVELAANHTVSGNPVRFQTGPIRLELDDAWRRDMTDSDRKLVERVTAPFRKSFGYD